MRIFLLTALTMIAFAANSLFARLAMVDGVTDPLVFGAVRICSGAVVLWGLVRLQSGAQQPDAARKFLPAAWLALYAVGFSLAYLTLETGAGALILFGGVQISIFAVTLWRGSKVGGASLFGASLAFGGLCYLLWPGSGQAPDFTGSVLMLAAAIGWGMYTLEGRGSQNPLRDTARAFIMASPLCLLAALAGSFAITGSGFVYAVLSGSVTSALGYALWYSVLPTLRASTAAVSQLTVPVIAVLAGSVFLSEPLTLRFALSCALVLGGVAIAILVPVKNAQ